MPEYTEEALQSALDDFPTRKIPSLRKVSELYQIPRSTLQSRLAGRPTRKESAQITQNLSPVQERYLAEWI
ncbi:hypothetical protein P152DRAFT_403719, partial [Eremomyces bilateralis CBS 781.70]